MTNHRGYSRSPVARPSIPSTCVSCTWSLPTPKPLTLADGQLVFDDTREPGVYRLTHAATGVTRYFVVQGDARESDLTPCKEEVPRVYLLFQTAGFRPNGSRMRLREKPITPRS